MLALRPQRVPLPDFHSTMPGDSDSVAHIPNLMENHVPTLLPRAPQASPSSKRPKLALNTSSVLPIFGKGSTSLRLETLSATSPTARNTFKNRPEHDRSSFARPQRPALTPLATCTPISSTRTPSPSRLELQNSATTTDSDSSPTTSTTSVSTPGSSLSVVSSKPSPSAKSILRNGSNSGPRSRRASFTSSRPIFTGAKKVAFHATLSEDITTSRYTWRHSDLEIAQSNDDTLTALHAEAENDERHDGHMDQDSIRRHIVNMTVSSPLKRRLEEDEEDDAEDDADVCPVTPVAGRRKKDREWVWTLAPIEPACQVDRLENTDVDETDTGGIRS